MLVPSEQLAEVFVEVADTLVDEFDLIEFLQMVTTHTSDLVHAPAVGLMLSDGRERLQLIVASDEKAEMLELFQVQSLEGPCQDCFRDGTPVVNADLTSAADRWPQFAPLAVGAGFRSVHAFPLRLRGEVIGALNLFGVEPVLMQPADVRVVQAVADIATIGILQERAIHSGEVLTEQLQTALNSRIVIEQAKGVLAQLHGLTPDGAFDLLRGYCRDRHLKLSQVADAVVHDPATHPRLTQAGSDTSR